MYMLELYKSEDIDPELDVEQDIMLSDYIYNKQKDFIEDTHE